MNASTFQTPSSQPSRGALEAARRKLEAAGGGVAERLARAEACFRLAVLPDTELEAAIDLMRQAADCDPYHPKMSFHLGRLLHLNGDPEGAVFEYRRALRLAPKSHRAHAHLALALADLGSDEQNLGIRLLEALQAGGHSRLGAYVAELDKLIAIRQGAKPKNESAPEVANAKPQEEPSPTGRNRWRGLWKLSLLNELARLKPVAKRAVQQLDEGKRLIEGHHGVSEYAMASLFFLLDGPKTCRQVEAWLRDNALASHQDRPAIRLVRATCELGEAANGEEFVERAGAKMLGSELPPELVCCLHYSWYGTSSSSEPVQAMALLDRYPEQFRSLPCFRELRLAILDHHARLAWSADRMDRAEILWQETIRLDPFRVPVAHNLAISATRAKSTEKYAAAWERAAELRYLLAASIGDFRVEIDDRRNLHRSFVQQSRLRYVPEAAGRRTQDPTDDELQAWMKDRDALEVWLREGELLYLNSRLRFLSPVHFLGITLNCSEEDAEVARDTLLRQFDLCFRGRRWAGAQVFMDLVKQSAEKACALAKDPVARKRDRYFATEEADADELARDTISRGLLMYRMIRLAAASHTPELKRAGLEIARFLLTMPWRALEPLCKKIIDISQDTDLLHVFLSYVCGLVVASERGDAETAASNLSALEDCIRAVPEALELRLVLCRLLLDTKRHNQAYEAALAALAMTAKMPDRTEAAKLQQQFVICIDNAALAEMPERLLSASRTDVPALLKEGRRVLSSFPKAGALRLRMAKYLIQSAEEDRSRLEEANKLLEEGLDLLLSDEQIREARRLLEKAGTRSKSIEAVKEIRTLLESASAHARRAVAAIREDRTPAKARQAREEIEEGLHEASQAEEIATSAELPAAAEKAREVAADLRMMLENIERG